MTLPAPSPADPVVAETLTYTDAEVYRWWAQLGFGTTVDPMPKLPRLGRSVIVSLPRPVFAAWRVTKIARNQFTIATIGDPE